MTVAPSPAVSCETLAYCKNVASLRLFYRFYFARFTCALQLHKKWSFPLRIPSVNVTEKNWNLLKKSLMENFIFSCSVPHSYGLSTYCFNKLQNFSVTIPGCFKDFYFNSLSPRTTRIWNYLPAEYFHLSYNLNGFKSKGNRHFFSLSSF